MIQQRQNWRAYQAQLKKNKAHKKLKNIAFKVLLFLPVLLISGYASTICFETVEESPATIIKSESTVNNLLTKDDLKTILNSDSFSNIKERQFNIVTNNTEMFVKTSLDMDLQKFLLKKISRVKKLKRGKPRYLAIVVMEPASGKIRALAGYNQTDESQNPCLTNVFPAASIFKIVTAAAAVEECGFTPSSKLNFNGGKYTLYKRQLKEKNNKYTNRISFKDSFAQSVNPVFGKIGSLYLGKQTLEKYAAAFGFNKSIRFETPLPISQLNISEEPYHWAEIASGFNRKTLISPLHGALLSGTIVNKGVLPEPTIIDEIIDSSGQLLYIGKSSSLNQAIKPETSIVLKKLMATTISSGTGKKGFRGYKKDPVLAKLNIGGKTGSIFNTSHDVRFDWFVGYAEEKNGNDKLAISVVVGHEKYIGTKACNYARMAIKRYYGKQFAKKSDNTLLAKNNINGLENANTIITR